MSRNCVTHHHACDCREAKFARIQKENDDLKDKIHHYFVKIDGDGPELSCPFIDGIAERYPEMKPTLERIRTINAQLRYSTWALSEDIEQLKSRLAHVENELRAEQKVVDILVSWDDTDQPHKTRNETLYKVIARARARQKDRREP